MGVGRKPDFVVALIEECGIAKTLEAGFVGRLVLRIGRFHAYPLDVEDPTILLPGVKRGSGFSEG